MGVQGIYTLSWPHGDRLGDLGLYLAESVSFQVLLGCA